MPRPSPIPRMQEALPRMPRNYAYVRGPALNAGPDFHWTSDSSPMAAARGQAAAAGTLAGSVRRR